MKCEEVIHLMHRQLDNDLTVEEEEHLLSHLSSCTDCQVQFEQLKQLSFQLESLPQVSPPHSIVDSILPQLEEISLNNGEIMGPSSSRRKRVKKRFWMPGLAMVACLFIALVVLNEENPVQRNSLSASEPEVAMQSKSTEEVEQNEIQQSFSTEIDEKDFAGILKEEENPSDTESFALLPAEESEPPKERMAPEATDDAQRDQGTEVEEAYSDPNEENPPMGLTQFTVEEEEKYPSPDGVYTAYLGLDKEEIFIDKEEEAYYISKNSWKAPWLVEHIAWVSNQRIYYVLHQPEVDEYQYWLIDVEERKEEQLEEAYKE